jgi:hypothetical protein
MDPTFSFSPGGDPTCKVAGLCLHSSYDPIREAERFARSRLAEAKPSHVILLGACLDYLSAAVRELLPNARLISVQYSSAFEGKTVGRPDASWFPDSQVGLDSFLDICLGEDAISGVKVLEWEPASRAFPEAAEAARMAVRAALDRLTSSTATVKASGKLWIANACASFLLAESLVLPRPTSKPVLIAAAGPSLPDSLAAVASSGVHRRDFVLVAVSSALAACLAASFEPDLVVSTDGGFWSRMHLYPLVSSDSVRDRAVLAAPLTALPSACVYSRTRLFALDQGSFAEAELLPALYAKRGPALKVPPHGTVSGSALQLAARLSNGSLVVAGLDLASYGEAEHARPHGFDAFLGRDVSRIASLETKLFARRITASTIELPQRPWRSSRSLMAYASALEGDAGSFAGRLFRMGPQPVPLAGFGALGAEDFRAMAEDSSRASISPDEGLFEEALISPRPSREGYLADRIRSWKGLASEAAASMAKGRLPGPGSASAGGALVSELLRSIDIVDYAAARRACLAQGDPRPSAEDLSRKAILFLDELERRFA